MADPLDKRYAKYKEPFMKSVCGQLIVLRKQSILKEPSITQISGVVLDLGSGLGQNLK